MVQCYQCDHRFEVGGSAQSTSCPGCNRPVMVADQIIKGQRGPIRELKTCGKVVVGKRGRLICQHIVAHAGLECEGIIDAKTVMSNTRVVLGPKANFRGDLTAPGVDIAQGAVIQSSYFRIGEPPPGYVPPPPTDPKMTPGANHPVPPAGSARTTPPRADDPAAPPHSDGDDAPTPQKKAPKKKAPKKKIPEKKAPENKDPEKKPADKPAESTPPSAPAKDDAPAKPAAKPVTKPATKKLKPAPESTDKPAPEPADDTPAPKKKAPKRRPPAAEGDGEAAPKKKLPKRRKKPGNGDTSAFAALAQWLGGVRLVMRSFLF